MPALYGPSLYASASMAFDWSHRFFGAAINIILHHNFLCLLALLLLLVNVNIVCFDVRFRYPFLLEF